MIEMKYGIYCEDIAQSSFMENIIPKIIKKLAYSERMTFKLDSVFSKSFAPGRSKKIVLSTFTIAANQAFSNYNLDILFIGVDLDNFDDEKFDNLFNDMKNKLDIEISEFAQKTIIFIPVQCIEHWLWYIKYHIDNPKITKNLKLEKKSNHDAKIMVYNYRRPTQLYIQEIVKNLTSDIDFGWLTSHSESFNHFFILFHNLLSTISSK